jgi:predicted house-cleaning noncanonical NTP pyrophosphatase (MazG superfamily)
VTFLATSLAAPEIVTDALGGMGFTGAVISVLLTTIGALGTVVVLMFRMLMRQAAERTTESAAVVTLVERNNSVVSKLAESTEERNRVTEALADAIKAQAGAFEMLTQRIDFYHEGNTEKLKDLREVVSAQADAVRVHTGVVMEVRNNHQTVTTLAAEMKAKIDTVAQKIDAAMARRVR